MAERSAGKRRGLFGTVVTLAASLLISTTAHAADRVALFVKPDPSDLRLTELCQTNPVEGALKELRFEITSVGAKSLRAASAQFRQRSSKASAAFAFACDVALSQTQRDDLASALQGQKLNFLFLLDATEAKNGTPLKTVLKTKRTDLMILNARVATPENAEIFARTTARKLLRPYAPPRDILSRIVVSTYYRSRGSMFIDLRGRVASGYILTQPPTEEILDAWSRVERSEDPAALNAFIRKYPKTLFADLARARIAKLKPAD
ncbi:MAG: hypothetical protein AAGJ70_07595 [Pseudomonadota bacterium]